jgi:[ribosomal protein S5]-alanine N-acetyltransferase
MDFILRPWCFDDVDCLIKYGSNPRITQFMSDGFSNLFTPEKAKAFIGFANTGSDKLYRAIEINGEASGGIGAMLQPDIYCRNAELGYWLAEPFWGNGIISRAIEIIVEEAFQNFNINRVYATPFATNDASQRVLVKAGFTLEACHPKKVFKNGEYLDELIYVIIR